MKTEIDDNSCFIICPIGEEDSATRKRSDELLEFVIEPALKECGYIAYRADRLDHPGSITSQVIRHIIDSPLVIADLTEANPNVYYELAIRHVTRKPLVQMITKESKLPFDVNQMRTIHYDLSLHGARQTVQSLLNQIRNVESKKENEVDTPISIALRHLSLVGHSNPEAPSIANLHNSIVDLSSAFANLQAHLENPRQLIPPEYLREVVSRMGALNKKGTPSLSKDFQRIAKLADFLSAAIASKNEKNQVTLINEIIDRLRMVSEELDISHAKSI